MGMKLLVSDEDGRRQIAGMDPLAFAALVAVTILLIIVGVNSDGDEGDPLQDPSPTVSTR